MALPIKGALPTDGNARIVKLFEEALERAKEGKAQFGLWIQCDPDDRGMPSQHFECAYDGAGSYDFPAYYALGVLQSRIQSGGLKRELPLSYSTVDRDASWVVHNLSKGAMSFDFTAWLVDAWMTMIAEGATPPLKICFMHPGKPGQTFDDPHSALMFEQVVRPMVRLIGAVETNEVCHRMKEHALFKDASFMARQGVPVPKFSASGKHLAAMRGYAGCVTITLRECEYWPHRNSNIPEWLKFAHWLKARGERVVFVRDTKYAAQPVDDWEVVPAAATELELRMALYQQAKCNCFVSNGPWNLALFSDVPWMMFVTVETSKEFDERDTFPSSKAGWWETYHGVAEGGQFPWSADNQRIVWENDTYERMKETWLAFFDSERPEGTLSGIKTPFGLEKPTGELKLAASGTSK